MTHAGALNFKDVMLAFGKLPREEVIDDILGCEFAGQVPSIPILLCMSNQSLR